jgi:hypothetical protein
MIAAGAADAAPCVGVAADGDGEEEDDGGAEFGEQAVKRRMPTPVDAIPRPNLIEASSWVRH